MGATLAALSFGAAGSRGRAQPISDRELKIGLSSEPTAIDPHFHYRPDNLALAAHIFDTLVVRNSHGDIEPSLAESWRVLDDRTWSFRLRRDVRFSDGAPFAAADVIFSIDRIGRMERSPAPLTVVTREIEAVEADGADLLIRTKGPYALVLAALSQVPVVSAGAARDAKTPDFNDGRAAVGTGPYKFGGWSRGREIILERNEGFRGPPEPWRRVYLRPIVNPASREAAILSGDVDLIEKPTGNDLPRLQARASVSSIVSSRLIYLMLNTREQVAAGAVEADGRNPLAQPEVRQAISLAIPRQAITDRLLAGLTVPARSLAPPDTFGSDPSLSLPFDLDRARQALASSGWGSGFGLTIVSPTTPDLNHVPAMQAVAAALTRLGLRIRLEATPQAVVLTRRGAGEFGAYSLGYGPDPDNGFTLRGLGMTRDAQAGEGLSNFSGFSDPEFDALARQAFTTVDEAERRGIYGRLLARANSSLHAIPLYFEPGLWVCRQGLTFTPRNDGRTLAMNVRPAD